MNPKLSAYAQINGAFDFNRTPLAPPGTKVLAFIDPQNCRTWGTHGLPGWYVGPAMESYRCFTIWITATRATRTTDTVQWHPKHVTMLTISTTNMIIAAAHNLAVTLQTPTINSPLAALTDSEVYQLTQLQQIFHRQAINKADPPPTNKPSTQPTKSPNPPKQIRFEATTNFTNGPR